MNALPDRKNENLILHNGGIPPTHFRRRLGRRPGPRVLSEGERDLERRMRDTFVRLKGPDGRSPSRGIAMIICDNGTTPWRAMGLRITEAIDAGCARELVRACAVQLLAWVDKQLAARENAGAPDALTSGEFPSPMAA